MAGQKKSPSEILQDGRAEKEDVIKAFGISVPCYVFLQTSSNKKKIRQFSNKKKNRPDY